MKARLQNNLMKNWLTTLGVLLLALSASLTPAAANDQQKKTPGRQENPPINLPIPTKTMLKCEPSSSDVAAQVKVTNSTSQAIPKGTTIYYQIKSSLSGHATVNESNGLQPNAWVVYSVGGTYTDAGACTAYFYKK